MKYPLVVMAGGSKEQPSVEPDPAAKTSHERALHWLALLAALLTCIYGLIAWLSWRFEFDSITTDRPIVAILILFTAAFLGYLLAIRLARNAEPGRRLLVLIVSTAIVFRVVMLFSVPIQEIDIYRYLWDGAVYNAGVSPFHFSPDEVRTADPISTTDAELRTLVTLREQSPALAEILRRVHFGELPTIYPPSSQAVFAAATATTPADSSLWARVLVMKTWLIAFDLATLALVIALLKLAGWPVGLSIIYAWCPLLLKEVANSGHLDAVAVFLTTLAVYLVARLIVSNTAMRSWLSMTAYASLIMLVLAAAVGAKLYPIVLAPLILLTLARRIGWRITPIPVAVFAVSTFLLLSPMMPREALAPSVLNHTGLHDAPPAVVPRTDPSQGVTTFLQRWEMNDFIFLVLVENLKPASEMPPERVAWFAVVPESMRQRIVAAIANYLNVEARSAPFLLTRAITGIVFFGVALALAWKGANGSGIEKFLEAGFLTLAWFWLLCPTQNPWYWTWALPLLPFARGRAWLAVSGIAMVYYLRFWLGYHWADTPVLGTRYSGTTFFDFIVTWIEFFPWLLCLAIAYVVRKWHASVLNESERVTSVHPKP